MGSTITINESIRETANAVSYEMAAAEFEKEAERTEDVCCNQLIKNLLMNNLRLLKLNEINSILLF